MGQESGRYQGAEGFGPSILDGLELDESSAEKPSTQEDPKPPDFASNPAEQPKSDPADNERSEAQPKEEKERIKQQKARDTYKAIVSPLAENRNDPDAILNFIRNIDSVINKLNATKQPEWAEEAKSMRDIWVSHLTEKLKGGETSPELPPDLEPNPDPEPDKTGELDPADNTDRVEEPKNDDEPKEDGTSKNTESTDDDKSVIDQITEDSPGVADAGKDLIQERFKQRAKYARFSSERRDVDEAKLDELNSTYAEQVTKQARSMMLELKHDESKSPEEIAEIMANFLAMQELRRSQQEIKLVEEKSPKRVTQFMEKIRHSKKARLAVNLALAASVVAAAATGVGGVVVGAAAAKKGWSALGGFWAGEGAHSVVSGRKHRSEIRDGVGGADGLSQDDFDQLTARVNSSRESRLFDSNAEKEKNIEQVFAQRSEQLRVQIAEILNSGNGDSIALATGRISEILGKQLDAETKRLGADRRSVRARRLSGLAGAAVATVVLPELIHKVSGLINHSGGSSGGHGSGGVENASGHNPPTHNETGASFNSQEINSPVDSVNYGDHGVAIDHVNIGESPEDFARKHLSRFKGWHEFSHSEQASKIHHFANQLRTQDFHDGARIRWNYDMAAGSFNFKS